MIYDIIIIGSGISGLYTAYNIKKMSPNTRVLILEKYKKKWVGGRTSNETYYGTEIVTGAGIGRRKKDKLLFKLIRELGLDTYNFTTKAEYSDFIPEINMKSVIQRLRKSYSGQHITFKKFAIDVLGETEYNHFKIAFGYTDYENEDAYDTLYSYGMEDNTEDLDAFYVPWRKMVLSLASELNIHFSKNVNKITKMENKPYCFLIETESGTNYKCDKVVVATTITGIRHLLPNKIYKDIEGQPFLRLYAKFSAKSIPIMKEYVKKYTYLTGPLQKIIPMDSDIGVYMIAYNDNKNALKLKDKLENTEQNWLFYSDLIEKSLGIPKHSVEILDIKDFYWAIGTHYYKPLNTSLYKNRDEFIHIAQHPTDGILVVGEVISKNQGWTEGALESVESVLTKKWIHSELSK